MISDEAMTYEGIGCGSRRHCMRGAIEIIGPMIDSHFVSVLDWHLQSTSIPLEFYTIADRDTNSLKCLTTQPSKIPLPY